MTVSELIADLLQMPQYAVVVLPDLQADDVRLGVELKSSNISSVRMTVVPVDKESFDPDLDAHLYEVGDEGEIPGVEVG